MKKIVMTLLIIGLLTIPITIIPVANASWPPDPEDEGGSIGDIVLGECHCSCLPNQWDHAAIYKGNRKVVEADPHTELWCKPKYWGSAGKVEEETLEKTASDYEYGLAYVQVLTTQNNRNKAVNYANARIGCKFDYPSYWWYDEKQLYGSWPPRAKKFYCTELVWASYRWQYIQLDPDGDSTRIEPRELDPDMEGIQGLLNKYWSTGGPD